MKKILTIITIILAAYTAVAQFNVSGEFRTRGEYRNGYLTIPTDETSPLSVVAQRTRLNVSYKASHLTTYISLQDARIWGEDQWKTDNYGTGLFEGWIKYTFNKNISFKVGRQKTVYDDARLFASGNWRTYGEAHDLAKIMYQNNDHSLKIHIGGAINNDSDNEKGKFISDYSLKSTHYKNMVYLWLNKDWNNGLKTSVTIVRDGFQQADDVVDGVTVSFPDKINYRNTIGPYLSYQSNSLEFSSAYYYQFGTTQTGKDLEANFFSARAAYKQNKSNKLTLGFDHYSGTDYSSNGSQNESNTFSTLYGPGHKYLGYMDFFGKPEKHGAGINDILLRTNFKVKKAGAFEITFHQFQLDKTTLKSGIKVEKNLGQEIDLVYKLKLQQNVKVQVGLSKMFYTQNMEQLKGLEPGQGKNAVFGWLMLSVKPNFFSGNNLQ